MVKSIEQNWADWEGNLFGLGYGTGEPHTIPALRRFLTLCSRAPNGQYDYEVLEGELGATVAWLLINALGRADIIEYGTSPRYAWLTNKGQALKVFMLSRTDDELITLAVSHDDPCYPDACNCDGYVEGKVCTNPFWQEDAARAFLNGTSTDVVDNSLARES